MSLGSVNDKGVQLALKKLAALGPGDFRTAFRRISRAWLAEVDSGFARERDPYGNPWAPLHPATIEEKKKSGSNHAEDILQDTGALRASFKAEVTRTGFSIFTDHQFADGTSPAIHQLGGTHPRTLSFIPARPFFPFDGIPDDWAQVAEGYLVNDFDTIFKTNAAA